MLKIGRRFQFNVPDGWEESRDGARWIYRSPSGAELTISSSLVEGEGSYAERQKAEGALLSNAMQAAREGANQDGLVAVVPLKRDEAVTDVPCWTFVSETPAKDTLFMGAVLTNAGGVLFVTLEGAHGYELLETFRSFLRSVRSPTS